MCSECTCSAVDCFISKCKRTIESSYKAKRDLRVAGFSSTLSCPQQGREHGKKDQEHHVLAEGSNERTVWKEDARQLMTCQRTESLQKEELLFLLNKI